MSFNFRRAGLWYTISYTDVEKQVKNYFEIRIKRAEEKGYPAFPLTISIKRLASFVARELDFVKSERAPTKFSKFVDFALRQLAIVKPAIVDDEPVDNNTTNYIKHIYLVEGLKESNQQPYKDSMRGESVDSIDANNKSTNESI